MCITDCQITCIKYVFKYICLWFGDSIYTLYTWWGTRMRSFNCVLYIIEQVSYYHYYHFFVLYIHNTFHLLQIEIKIVTFSLDYHVLPLLSWSVEFDMFVDYIEYIVCRRGQNLHQTTHTRKQTTSQCI